jgi:hypothetical protein
LLKLNSNTAGLPSVAEAGVIVATVGAASLSLIVPVAEAVPEAIVKVSDSAIVSGCWYRYSSRSSTRRYSYCLRSGSNQHPAVPLVNVKVYVVSQKVAQAEFKPGLPSVAEAGVIVATVEPHHYH